MKEGEFSSVYSYLCLVSLFRWPQQPSLHLLVRDNFMLWSSAKMLCFAMGHSREAQLLLEKPPYFRCIFIPHLHTGLSKHGNTPHCSVHVQAFSTARACSGMCFRMSRGIGKEELMGHLGYPLPTQGFSLMCCPHHIGGSDQALWEREWGQMKDA